MKDKFFKQLKAKLKVLNEEEKNDIVNEYEDIINEKVKNGKTEEEAIKEFGNIDDLAKEILKAYKINPNYSNNIIDDSLNIIEKGAKKIEDVTNDVINKVKQDDNLNSDTLGNIIAKILIIILLVAVLRIPFSIIGYIGFNILDINPFNGILPHVFKGVLELVYLALCIYIVYIIAKNLLDKQKEDNKEVKKEKPNDNKIPAKEQVKSVEKKDDVLEKVLITVIKIWCFIIIEIPLIFIFIGLLIVLSILIWLATKQIVIVGLIMLILGFLTIVGQISDILIRIISSKKIKTLPIVINMIISIILIVLGIIFTFDYFISLDKYNSLPKNIKTDTYTYNNTVTDKTYINYDTIIIDDSLEDKIKIDVSYYNDFIDIYTSNRNDKKYCESNNCYTINSIIIKSKYKHDLVTKYSNIILDDLKNNEVYNYSKLDNYKVTIYVSSKNKDLIIKY